MKITKDMNIAQILEGHQYLVPVFFRHGLFCLGCVMAQMESVEEAALVHGIDIDALIDDLNATVEEHENSSEVTGEEQA